jgi:hypothetical protein
MAKGLMWALCLGLATFGATSDAFAREQVLVRSYFGNARVGNTQSRKGYCYEVIYIRKAIESKGIIIGYEPWKFYATTGAWKPSSDCYSLFYQDPITNFREDLLQDPQP